MTPLRYRAWQPTARVTASAHPRWKGGRYISGGYVHVKVVSHPRQDKRGYIPEHILIVENNIRRYLNDDECVHHKDGNRQNNDPSNLEIMYSHKHHMDQHPRARNANSQFVAADPIFEDIKFRLHDVDAGVTKVYSLSKLINTTFRRGRFQFRGRSTGLTDKNGKEIFEGDVVEIGGYRYGVQWMLDTGCFELVGNLERWVIYQRNDGTAEVIGNIYENPELLP